MQKLCRQKGYEPDVIDLAENLDSQFEGDDCIKLSYTTNEYEVYMIAEIEPDRLVAMRLISFDCKHLIINKRAFKYYLYSV